jgi:hypothetical protein
MIGPEIRELGAVLKHVVAARQRPRRLPSSDRSEWPDIVPQRRARGG